MKNYLHNSKGKIIRYVDIKPIGNDLFLVSDPLSLAEDFIINKIVLLAMFLFDGTRNFEEVRKEIIQKTGILITEDQFKEIVEFFNENGLFLDENFYLVKQKREEELKSKGYIESYFFHSFDGSLISHLKLDRIEKGGDYLAAIVPHLDLRIAVDAYYQAYSNIKTDKYKRVFVFGVSHYFHPTIYSICPLDFQTPFGIVKTDKEAVVKFQEEFKIDVFNYILSYRKEHSIFFQLPYIKYLIDKVKIVAVLVSYHEDIDWVKKQLELFADFITKNYSDSIFISSIDLSHVGSKFGDDSLYDPEEIDKNYIDFLVSIDPEGALSFLLQNQNKTRIDGVLTNYLFLKVLQKLGFGESKLLQYNKYFEKQTNSIVSYVSIVYK